MAIDLSKYFRYEKPLPKDKWPYKSKIRPARLRDLNPLTGIPAEQGGCAECAGTGGIWRNVRFNRLQRKACAACRGTGRTARGESSESPERNTSGQSARGPRRRRRHETALSQPATQGVAP